MMKNTLVYIFACMAGAYPCGALYSTVLLRLLALPANRVGTADNEKHSRLYIRKHGRSLPWWSNLKHSALVLLQILD